VQVHVAETRDAEAIVAVINVAFRLAEGFLLDRDRIDLETVQGLFRKGTFLVAEDNSLCGCVYVEPRAGEPGTGEAMSGESRGGDRSYLGLLAVDPRLQKSGLGSQLMNAAEAHCARAGSRFMDLRIVNIRKELPGFYHRLGYVETGTQPFTPGLNPKLPCHFVVMSKPLT
jgi:GNAT superfamily N-acetyltransferase